MTAPAQDPGPGDGPGEELAGLARLSSINAVFGLSLILTQASSASQAMRLVTTAVPSIAPGHTAVAWHPDASGPYYERAPDQAVSALTRLIGAGRLDVDGVASCWAVPVTSPLRREPIFLVIMGEQDPSQEETFLLSVLAQMCGTVIANHELRAEADLRERADRERDIAQARAAELAASEARQRTVLEAALDAVVSIDTHGRVTYVNTASSSAATSRNCGLSSTMRTLRATSRSCPPSGAVTIGPTPQSRRRGQPGGASRAGAPRGASRRPGYGPGFSRV